MDAWSTGEAILGTGDIQSLADLANSYSVVREMNLVPFGRGDVAQLVGATALPLLPLLGTQLDIWAGVGASTIASQMVCHLKVVCSRAVAGVADDRMAGPGMRIF